MTATRVHIRIGALLLAAFSPSAHTFVQSIDSQSVAERGVREASASEVQALLTRDAKTLAGLWSDELVVTNLLNELVNKQRVLALVGTDTLAFEAYERQIEYVRVYGQIAVVAGSERVVWAGKMPMAGKPWRLRFTAVWQQHQGRWQEVARHANIIGAERES
jgi:hypothetical protein